MSTNETTPISAETRAAATVHAELPRHQLALLGTMTGSDAPRALLRTPNGRVITVRTGEKAGRDMVVGIEEGRVQLARGRKTYSLTMPGN